MDGYENAGIQRREVGLAMARPQVYQMAHREAAKLTRAPHNRQARQYNADAAKAKTDFREYALIRPLVPEHYVSGGYSVVVKTQYETVDSGESVRIFVWADSRAHAAMKAVQYIPTHIIEKPEGYVITVASAGRVDPKTKDGVITCPKN